MEDKAQKTISSKLNAKIRCAALPGHFATNHSHINYYIDLTAVKVQHRMARLAAAELARRYDAVAVDALICLEGTEMIGAFIADELSKPGSVAVNAGKDISVLAPEFNANNQLLFRENTQPMVLGKNIVLLVSTASTGKTINRALDCLQYYKSSLVGISCLFTAVEEMEGIAVNSVFTQTDLPDYRTYVPGKCQMCEDKRKIDAIANSFGYSRLN